MKKIIIIAVFSLVALSAAGCGKKPYAFKEAVSEIETVEIVSAENSLVFTVTKTLSETEKSEFLQMFQTIKFSSYYAGDPMSVSGSAVKITYQNGSYEMICYYWAEYVKDGEISFVRKSCEEKAFHELLDQFLNK